MCFLVLHLERSISSVFLFPEVPFLLYIFAQHHYNASRVYNPMYSLVFNNTCRMIQDPVTVSEQKTLTWIHAYEQSIIRENKGSNVSSKIHVTCEQFIVRNIIHLPFVQLVNVVLKFVVGRLRIWVCKHEDRVCEDRGILRRLPRIQCWQVRCG